MHAYFYKKKEEDMKTYYNQTRECMPQSELNLLQSQLLVKQVAYVYDRVPAYAKKMDEAGIKPHDIKSINDLKRLPFSVKSDMRDNYPFGLFAVPQTEIVRLHASSGTTGKLTVVGYTKEDMAVWAEVMARCLTMAGADKTDTVHVAYGYGLFTGGLGANLGSETIGATTVPVSVGNTARQIMLLKDFGATILCCTPSYAIYLAEELEKLGIKPNDLKLKAGVFGAEPWTEEMRQQIEKRLNILALDIYGLSEIIGPGVAMECNQKCGLHIMEDHFYPEIINSDTGEVLPDGTEGELVLTTLTKQGIPLIRYRTRDIAVLDRTPCKCGRTLVRMKRIRGRTDDMLIIRGVNVFPSQIETVLMSYEKDLNPQYQIIVTRSGALDSIEIQAELAPSNDILLSEPNGQNTHLFNMLTAHLEKSIESMLGIGVTITLVPSGSLPRSEGKAKRVFDKR